METSAGTVVRAVLFWATDWVLEQFLVITPGYLNASSSACLPQASVTVTGCGRQLLENLATTLYALSGLGAEILSAIGVAGS